MRSVSRRHPRGCKTDILQTAYSSAPQVDTVAEMLIRPIARVHDLFVPRVVTKQVFQIAYSSVPQLDAVAETVT